MHEDTAGVLDKSHYTYDAMGNKTAIQKQRRGLPKESGCYQYSYDKLQRLIGVEKDGKHIRSYQYDTFSNRIEMEDNTKGIKNIYQYNALNQLIEQKIWETPDITTKINTFINGNDIDNIKHNNNANILHKTFTYDKRGNLTGEYQEDALLHGYHFNRMNRLEKAWNHQGEEAQYFYNALGQRTGRTANEGREDYLLDLTKPYHNLLELQKGKQTQIFFWDFNAAVMEDEKRNLQYYLQDELGSPLRVLYRNGYGEAYGYDEFGTELYESDSIKEEKTRKKYGKQGENQPFGYTGYRYDNISGSYFAQAREYMPEVGRFISEDIIHGKCFTPKTLNRYEYCLGNPIIFIDSNGKEEERYTSEEINELFLEDGIDSKGVEIGMHYLIGGGSSIDEIDGEWGDYLMKNEVLAGKVGDIVMPIGDALEEGSSIKVSMQIPMEIENGEGIIGYQYLHGTNEDAGGFQINGTISKNNKGDIILSLIYAWNDIMDPNPNYATDIKKSDFAKQIPFINPMDYEMHIIWYDKTIIRKNEGWFNWNKGWLKNWNKDWMPSDYLSIPWLSNWENELTNIKLKYSNYYLDFCAD